MIKLQLAMDILSLNEALHILDKIHDYIDIAEIGTPFVYRSGLEAIRKIRSEHPNLYILCDSKIMDAGAYESMEQYESGADCVSVLAVTDDATIKACIDTARKYGKELSVDTICVADLATRSRQIEEMGADIISVHTGVDQQMLGRTPIDDLKVVSDSTHKIKISVAGGINVNTVDDYMQYDPDVIIVGGGILSQEDPVTSARMIYDKLKAYNKE